MPIFINCQRHKQQTDTPTAPDSYSASTTLQQADGLDDIRVRDDMINIRKRFAFFNSDQNLIVLSV